MSINTKSSIICKDVAESENLRKKEDKLLKRLLSLSPLMYSVETLCAWAAHRFRILRGQELKYHKNSERINCSSHSQLMTK